MHMDNFKPVACPFPNSHGDLVKLMPTMAIKEVNKHIEDVMSRGKQRQKYQKVSIEVKTKVAKYVAENGVKATVMKFQGQVPNAPKNWKNTVCDWKNAY